MKFSKSISDKGSNKINFNNLPVNSIINSYNNGSYNNKKIVSFAKSTVYGEEAKIDGNGSANGKKFSRAQSTSVKFFQNSAIKLSQSSTAKNNVSVVNKSAVKKK